MATPALMAMREREEGVQTLNGVLPSEEKKVCRPCRMAGGMAKMAALALSRETGRRKRCSFYGSDSWRRGRTQRGVRRRKESRESGRESESTSAAAIITPTISLVTVGRVGEGGFCHNIR